MLDPSDKRPFAELMQGLAANFRVEIGTPYLQALWFGLEDLALEQVGAAAVRALRELKFMPTVAELRARAPIPPPRRSLRESDDALRARCWGSWDAAPPRQRLRGVGRGDDGPVQIGDVMSRLAALAPGRR